MTSETSTVAITGCSGYIGTRLVERLASDESIRTIVGLDVHPPRTRHPKLVFDEVDVRSPALAARLAGVDCVVHLAFVTGAGRAGDETQMRDVNVNGSQNVFKSAARAGVRRLVYTSSATVYGAHPDNEVPLTEESPLRANLDFSYAAHKLEVEYVLRELRDELSETHLIVLRPATVLGPHADSPWSHLLEQPVLFGVAGHMPPLQVVHEDDVARALHWAVTTSEQGTFNLAAEGWLEGPEAVALSGRRVRFLPEPVAFGLAERMWRLGISEVPPGYLHYAMHPWVVSTDKLAAAGFTCERGHAETLDETVAAARGDRAVRIGTRRVRRGDLLRGAAAGLGLAGAALALRSRRRPAA
ncbi:MAG TPA: NAD-dependent epimerase/dehydratase family protein [Actinomycetota bacterium]|nr:NAD-dependent epimerase/dehydratase family protein [Actinomycetota bacterium]